MSHHRQDILEWSEQGRIAPQNLREAMHLAGALPDAGRWRHFIDAALLYGGAVLLASGIIFFFAYNWENLHRYAKFALVQAALLATLGWVLYAGVDRPSGKAALLLCTLLTGALLALLGQIYQTGADTYELFAYWALFILPWVVLARFAPLWLLWLGIVNLAVVLYFELFGGLFGLIFAEAGLLWVLLGLNTIALAAWELLASAGVEWLQPRWGARLLITASAGCATGLALVGMLGWLDAAEGPHELGWFAWLAAAYTVYRKVLRDLYALALGVLSVIIVTAVFLGKHMLESTDAAFLFIGLVVIGLSAAGGWWLRQVAAEEHT